MPEKAGAAAAELEAEFADNHWLKRLRCEQQPRNAEARE